MIHARSSGHRVPAGFSLVEMAVVTLLIGIFLTLGLGALSVAQENASASNTQKNLDAIRDAFVNYVRANKCLPCPDTEPASGSPPDGRENRSGGSSCAAAGSSCPIAFGVLPYLDLGLTREAALDGWGNLFSYHVSVGGTRNWTVSGPFVSTGNPGALTVQDRNSSSPFALYSLSTAAVAVVVSHGRNGLGAYTTKGTRITLPDAVTNPDENENTNGTTNTTYVRRTRTDTEVPTIGSFDDYVMYVVAEDLLGPLIKDGSVKWADVATNDQLERIRNALIGYLVATPNGTRASSDCTTNGSAPFCRNLPFADSNCDGTEDNLAVSGCLPINDLGLDTTYRVDAWGRNFTYTVNSNVARTGSGRGIGSANTTATGCPAATVAFSVTSSGSNTSSATDDISYTITCSELRGVLGSKIP